LPVINLTFQTSDLARFALIMYTARILSKKQEKVHSFKEAFIPVILPVAIICALILPENLSTAGVLFFTCLVLMFIGRVKLLFGNHPRSCGSKATCCFGHSHSVLGNRLSTATLGGDRLQATSFAAAIRRSSDPFWREA